MSETMFSTIVVTGASSGIGEAIAKKLAAPGQVMYLIARSSDRLEEVARANRNQGADCRPIALDITANEAIDQIDLRLQKDGRIPDLLVNNAGFGAYGYFHRANPDSMLNMIELNIKSLVKMTRRFLPGMVERNRGTIMNVSSVAGFQPVPFMATYSATKAFVTSFSCALHAELRGTDVRVFALCPGRTKTNFQLTAGSDKIRIRSRSASAADVADVAVAALHKRNPIAIEGILNKLSTHIQRFFPRRLVLYVAHQIFKPKPS